MGSSQDVIHDRSLNPAHHSREDAPDHEYDWTTYAALSGIVGALVVAVFFLAVDLLSARPPLWTPAVLGSALFLGEAAGMRPDFDPMSRTPVVVGYTVMHGVVFIGFGAMAASARLTRERVRDFGPGVIITMAILIFAGLQVTFAALGWVTGPEVGAKLSWVWISLANALAACAMTATIALAARRLSQPSLQDDSTGSGSPPRTS